MKEIKKMDDALALSIVDTAIKVALEEENNAPYRNKVIQKAVSNAITELEIGYLPLGVKELENYVFSNYRQTLVVLKSNSFTKENLINVLGKKYLDDNYSKFNDKGHFMGYDLSQLQDDLTQKCLLEGNYDIENVKGYGIFADPLSKHDLVVNTEKIWGTAPNFDGKRIRGKIIFSNQKDLNLNKNQKEVSKSEVKRFADLLMTWNFSRSKQDMRLLAGWILMAPFAGVSKWRTHTSLTGIRGSGKSTLQELIKNILGKFAKMFEGSSSEPGLRQQMGNSSGALLLDESEADGQKLAQILAMLRASSSGIQKALGTNDQNGKVFELKMAGLLGGIVPPALKGADNSRFLKIELGVRDEKLQNDDLFNVEWQEELGLQMIMTMINNFKIIKELIDRVKILFLQKGYDSRYADTYGPLIAASFFMFELVDEPVLEFTEDPFNSDSMLYKENCIKPYTIEDLSNYLDEFDFEKEKEQSKYSDEDELLNQIFTTELSDDELRKENILQFILGYHLEKGEKSLIKRLLGRYGIKTEKGDDDEIYIFIDCNDLSLKKLLKYTRFGTGDIKAVLKRVKYAEELHKEVSIGNTKRSRNNLIKIRLDKTKYSLKDEVILEKKEDTEDNPF